MSQTAIQQAAAALVANATTDIEFRRAEVQAKIEAIMKESDTKVQNMQDESNARIAAMKTQSVATIARRNEIAEELKKTEIYRGQDERANIRKRGEAERYMLDEESRKRMDAEKRVMTAKVDILWKKAEERDMAEIGGEWRLGKRRRE